MIQQRYLTSLTSEIESLLSGLVGSDFTSTWQGEDKRKGWGGGGHYYFEGGNYFIYSCLRRGGGKDFSREAINQGTAIIQGNMVNNFSRSPRSKQLVSD